MPRGRNMQHKILKERNKKTISVAPSQPPPAKVLPAAGGSLFSVLTQGFSFGAGSSLGHKVIDGIMGKSVPETVSSVDNKTNNTNECKDLKDIYDHCLQSNGYCNQIQSDYLDCLQKMEYYREIKRH